MIYGIGNDIIEVERIKKALSKDNGFKEKVFSKAEIDCCETKSNKYQSYAARFAGKEAFMKAFKTGWGQGVSWNEIEITSLESGQPILRLSGNTKEIVTSYKITKFHITLSHLKDIAMATVVLECE